jgi:hypothetical protein
VKIEMRSTQAQIENIPQNKQRKKWKIMWGSVLLHFHVHRAVADFKYLEKLPTLYFILNTV